MLIETYNDEKELLLRLRSGDHEAFEAVYHRYKVRLARNLLRMLKSPEVAEDLLQELFIRLWTHRHTIDAEQSMKAYLFRVARNLIYDTYRRLARDKKMQQQVFSIMAEGYTHIEENLIRREDSDAFHRAIDLLPAKRKEVFILCKLESKSYEEVGNLLKISISTVNDHIHKANRFLKQYFATQSHLFLLLLMDIVVQNSLL